MYPQPLLLRSDCVSRELKIEDAARTLLTTLSDGEILPNDSTGIDAGWGKGVCISKPPGLDGVLKEYGIFVSCVCAGRRIAITSGLDVKQSAMDVTTH